MKIPSNNLQALNHAATKPKPSHTKEAVASSEINGSSTPASISFAENATVRPAKSASQGPKPVPPGLERVLARLQSLPSTELNSGQANALSRINRNIARYQEIQSMGGTQTNPPPVIPTEPETQPVETATSSSTGEVGEGSLPTDNSATAVNSQSPNETGSEGGVTINADSGTTIDTNTV